MMNCKRNRWNIFKQESKLNIRYVINESRFNASQLCKMKKGIKQMSDEWLLEDGGKRILEAVNGDEELMFDILEALGSGKVEKVLSR